MSRHHITGGKRMKDFNAGYMENKLKRGWTISDFIQDLELSEGEFHNEMMKRFSKKLRKFYKGRLDQNQKRRDKNKRNNIHKTAKLYDGVAIQENTENNCKEISLELEDGEDIKDLDELKLREKEIKEEISRQEELKTFFGSKIEEEEKILKQQKFLLQSLYDEINNVNTQINSSIKNIEEFSVAIEKTEKEIFDKTNMLLLIKKEIKELETVTILVLDNEEIEVENFGDIIIPETWKDIYRELLESDVVENLLLKQIKQLAKIIAFVKSEDDRSFDVIFENEHMQRSFDKVRPSEV